MMDKNIDKMKKENWSELPAQDKQTGLNNQQETKKKWSWV